ncbi:hypothetical protein HZU40_30260 [Mycolicibacterium fluoranthenivorans]|jgi:hypothetical protein|uniref:Uncharacterized protein n=2 Tax=Mycolicibacterium fluoranthenivorans TaxID=258505 RepID=A0A7G8PPX8_9MYCO|nr:hypothetical protein HZU40_30260 [Mycolicibacterium fluoranthenivorans]
MLSAETAQTALEVLHWRLACEALQDLDAVAAPQAWASLETYLRHQVRDRLGAIVAGLVAEAVVLERRTAAGHDLGDIRRDLLRLRARYLQVETVLDFYGDAINTRTNSVMSDLLRGYDTLASDSMARTLEPLGLDAPPALVYVDKGLGAAILRAGVRLWDAAHASPAAAIKLTRHNLSFPTAMLHETGHQVAHQTGWNSELADLLMARLAPRSREVAEYWSAWSSEIAADVHAFGQAGWTPVFALANVVDGSTSQVYRILPGDPHPYPLIRVLFNVAMCHSWFGPGPWDRLATAWLARHPVERAPEGAAGITRVSIAAMGDILDICTRVPMHAFHGVPFTAVVDPRRVSPAALASFAAASGDSLGTSSYLRRRDPLRVFAVLAGRTLEDPVRAGEHRSRLRRWVADLGADNQSLSNPSDKAA